MTAAEADVQRQPLLAGMAGQGLTASGSNSCWWRVYCRDIHGHLGCIWCAKHGISFGRIASSRIAPKYMITIINRYRGSRYTAARVRCYLPPDQVTAVAMPVAGFIITVFCIYAVSIVG